MPGQNLRILFVLSLSLAIFGALLLGWWSVMAPTLVWLQYSIIGAGFTMIVGSTVFLAMWLYAYRHRFRLVPRADVRMCCAWVALAFLLALCAVTIIMALPANVEAFRFAFAVSILGGLIIVACTAWYWMSGAANQARAWA